MIDIKNNKEIQFNYVAELGRELLISNRTINRWILDKKLHNTKSLKYPLIKINLPQDWNLLRSYKLMAGIYIFVNGKNSYLGSSQN